MSRRPTVLFLCVHNAGRSQMAAGFARQIGGGEVVVHSAGSAPGVSLNPAVVEAMREVGVDISKETPKKLLDEMALEADVIVTMGCGDECPYYPSKRYEDWDLPDPSGQGIEIVRAIRDDLARRVRVLLSDLISGPG